MAKKKKKKVKPGAQVSELMNAFVTSAEKKLGPGIMHAGGEHVQHHIGVPFPALALEYLFGSNVLYLGAGYGIAGPSQSFKSSLGIEFGRILANRGSLNFLCETEGGKISGDIIKSIYAELQDRLRMRLVKSVEEAQDFLSFTFDYMQKQFPDRDQLVGLFLDSLNGPSSDERHKTIKKSGHASRDFPVEALLWTKWLQDWLPKLTGWPVTLILVNHKKLDVKNPLSFRHPGGDAQDFYSTVYMHVRRVRQNETVARVATQLQIKTVKHSFMIPGRKINAIFILDKPTERLYFDWGHSTADLLASDDIRPSIKGLLDVTTTSNSMTAATRAFSCKQLGMKGVTGTELGAAVNGNEELMVALRKALYIKTHAIWDGVMPELLPEHNGHDAGDLDDAEEGDDLEIG